MTLAVIAFLVLFGTPWFTACRPTDTPESPSLPGSSKPTAPRPKSSPAEVENTESGIYQEWAIPGFTGVKYVASGEEDGIDYGIYRAGDDGRKLLALVVHPIVRNDQGKYCWGHPWTTKGVAFAQGTGDVRLLATFQHKVDRGPEEYRGS